jgi:predicted membrane-bound spermidine synthase
LNTPHPHPSPAVTLHVPIVTTPSPPRHLVWLLLAGTFLVSFSLLGLEISLTRVLSVVLSYHYVFLVISLSLLGLGGGALYVHLASRGRPAGSPWEPLSRYAGLFSAASALSAALLVWVSGSALWGLAFILPLVPFFFAGAFLACAFRSFASQGSKLYSADLLGAATGSMASLFLLDKLGGVSTLFLLAAFPALAALALAWRVSPSAARRLLVPAFSLLMALALLGGSWASLPALALPLGKSPDKEISSSLANGGRIVETRWSAFGRTDLVGFANDPTRMVYFVDGGAGTEMFRFNGNPQAPDAAITSLKEDFPGYFPLSNLPSESRESALIIGPGGGRDVLLALMAGFRSITAVEVNPDLVALMQTYGTYNGGLYNGFPGVQVVVNEGRNFLRRSTESYDLIFLSLPIVKTSRSLDGYSLTEDSLFTVDLMRDYLSRLSDRGRLVVVAHTPFEVMKLTSLVLATLQEQGIGQQDAMQHLYAVGADMFPSLIVQKAPIAPLELQMIQDRMQPYLAKYAATQAVHGHSGSSNDLTSTFAELRSGGLAFAELVSTARSQGYNLQPVSDDSPFFYKDQVGLPGPVMIVFWLGLLALIAAALLVPRLLPQTGPHSHRHPPKLKSPSPPILFFALLGVGYMLAEISLAPRLTLFLGRPVLSLAVLLATLLLGSGLGSLASSRIPVDRIPRVLAWLPLAITALLAGSSFLVPALFDSLLGLPLMSRVLVAAGAILPIGFLLGFPFPLGIRQLEASGQAQRVPWMWAINSLSSVVGSALALILAMTWGFPQALLAGATVYAGVALPFLWQRSPLRSSRLRQTKARGSLAAITVTVLVCVLLVLAVWSSFTRESPLHFASLPPVKAVIIHPGLATSPIEERPSFHLLIPPAGSPAGLLPPSSV